jgi:biopolymer transport protein ExbD
MKIGSPYPHKKARIEIIPLIDIMFFLLASFMLASLSMMRLQSIRMDLPTATVSKGKPPEMINLKVDKLGDVFVEKQGVNLVQLQNVLSNRFRLNTNIPVYITGDPAARHWMVIRVLDLVRQQGIQKVSYSLNPPSPGK